MIALFSILQILFNSVMTLHTPQYNLPSMLQGSASPVAKCCRVFYLVMESQSKLFLVSAFAN